MLVTLQRYTAAIAATRHTHTVLPAGAANLEGGPKDKGARVEKIWGDLVAWLNRQGAPPTDETKTRIDSLMAKAYGAGNCGEQAAVAYMYLTKWPNQAVRPISYLLVPKSWVGNHAFVVLGPCANVGAGALTQWGPGTIICDPWMCQGYTRVAVDLGAVAQQHKVGAYTPAQYVDALDASVPGWEEVRIIHQLA